jgi:hypothetical protein
MVQFIAGAVLVLAILNPSATINIMSKMVNVIHDVGAPIVNGNGEKVKGSMNT